MQAHLYKVLDKSSAKLKYMFRIRDCVEVEFSKEVIAGDPS